MFRREEWHDLQSIVTRRVLLCFKLHVLWIIALNCAINFKQFAELTYL